MATNTVSPTSVTTVEPGGIEAIPSSKRHGSPWQLLATWSAPNLEFATVFVGVIAIGFFGLSFEYAVLAIVLGTAFGALTQGILSTWGPREGLAQLVLSRTAFGNLGNILPAGINAIVAGLGWFAVNSVSGAFALSALIPSLPFVVSLIIIVVIEVVVAFVGHDLVQVFERYSSIVLGIIFLIAAVIIFTHANLSIGVVNKEHLGFSFGGFTLATGAAFGYAAGWNPYASDYSRYLPKATSRVKIGVAAGLGNFVACAVLEIAGAASAFIAFNGDNPTNAFVHGLPTVIADLTLVAIAIGAIAANALNVYSGAMSFLALGIKIPLALRRAIVAATFGVIGFFIAWSAEPNAGATYTGFLLVIAYWIAPWLGIVFVDRLLRRGTAISGIVPAHAKYRNLAGPIAFVISVVASIWLFANQYGYFVGVIPNANPSIGDLTALVGFVLAAVLYFVLFKAFKPTLGGPLADEPDDIIGVDAADSKA
jgi:nucleobase:cation symporter-1, NCS1 family